MKDSFKVDRYVTDVLMRDLVSHDHSPAAFLVYLYLTSLGAANRNKSVNISLFDLADATGLARRTVQHAIAHLKRRRLIVVEQAHETAVPDYSVLRPWRRTTSK